MKKIKCAGCSERDRCKDTFNSWVFFIIGIIATVAIRVVTVLENIGTVYGKAAWYIGVGGFFLFFIYKYRVNQSRLEFIRQENLVQKIAEQKQLSNEDYNIISSILCSISSNKERINYLFIFGLSAVALGVAFYMDFLKK